MSNLRPPHSRTFFETIYCLSNLPHGAWLDDPQFQQNLRRRNPDNLGFINESVQKAVLMSVV
eukprot:2038528-Prorocentrum_lima.AAC.1